MGILSGRAALVTGASSGVGYGVALRFAEEGANVIACARRMSKLEELAEDAQKRGFKGKIIPVTCDVSHEADLDKVVKRTIDEFGKVDILACIAQGGLDRQRPIMETTPDDIYTSVRTGPLYTMLLMQKCFPYMKEQHYGRIITCASGSAVSSTIGVTAYAMAKAMIMTLTRKAAHEWGQYGIVTNCIFPVIINEHFGKEGESPVTIEMVARQSPVRYMGDAYEDGSQMVAFLASEGAKYINGQMIGICGGLQCGEPLA